MLRDIIYEILMKATNFAKGIWIFEDLVDLNKNIFGRALRVLGEILNKILTVCFWIGWYSFLISITGGLYLIWLAVKLMWKASKRERKNRKPRRKRA